MKQFLKNLYNNKFNNFAFSLIELSIVLIIIGLLIAGVMGGQSLIENAKVLSFTREIRDWKQAVNTFYVAKGRLPSDANNDGKIGYGSNEGHLDHYFPLESACRFQSYLTGRFHRKSLAHRYGYHLPGCG